MRTNEFKNKLETIKSLINGKSIEETEKVFKDFKTPFGDDLFLVTPITKYKNYYSEGRFVDGAMEDVSENSIVIEQTTISNVFAGGIPVFVLDFTNRTIGMVMRDKHITRYTPSDHHVNMAVPSISMD